MKEKHKEMERKEGKSEASREVGASVQTLQGKQRKSKTGWKEGSREAPRRTKGGRTVSLRDRSLSQLHQHMPLPSPCPRLGPLDTVWSI